MLSNYVKICAAKRLCENALLSAEFTTKEEFVSAVLFINYTPCDWYTKEEFDGDRSLLGKELNQDLVLSCMWFNKQYGLVQSAGLQTTKTAKYRYKLSKKLQRCWACGKE